MTQNNSSANAIKVDGSGVTQPTFVTARPIKSDFRRGLKYAKRLGQYNPVTQTWTIPADRPELGNLKAYGLELVTASSSNIGTDHITDDRFVLDGGSLSKAMEDEHSSL